jgi:hypothetical protein
MSVKIIRNCGISKKKCDFDAYFSFFNSDFVEIFLLTGFLFLDTKALLRQGNPKPEQPIG